MTTNEYLAALSALNLKPSAKTTAEALGISLRMAQYYAAGRDIPLPVALLLREKLKSAQAGTAPA